MQQPSRAATKARTAFTMQLMGLLDTLVLLLPDNNNLLRAEVGLTDLNALYPTYLIELWGGTVVPICGAQLLAKDLDFFMALDVPTTVQRLQDEGTVPADLDILDLDSLVETAIRTPIRTLQPADQAKCMDRLAILTSLATAYHSATTSDATSSSGSTKTVATAVVADPPAADPPSADTATAPAAPMKKRRLDDDVDVLPVNKKPTAPPQRFV